MGSLGYKGIERFFPKLDEPVDPQIQQMQQQIQQMQQQLQSQMEAKQLDSQTKLQIEQMRGQSVVQVEQLRMQTKSEGDQLKSQTDMQKSQIQAEIDQLNTQLGHAKSEVERGKLINARDALLWKMELDAATLKLSARNDDKKEGIEKAKIKAQPNPDNRQSTVISNNRHGSVPGQAG